MLHQMYSVFLIFYSNINVKGGLSFNPLSWIRTVLFFIQTIFDELFIHNKLKESIYIQSAIPTLTVTEIHPITYGQGQVYRFLGHQS